MMKSWFRAAAVIAVLASAAGCSFYFGDDGDDICAGVDDGAGVPAFGLRNPDNGVCDYWGGGGGCGCYPCDSETDAVPQPDWALCPAQCEGLTEDACLTTPGCRGAYVGFVCPPGTGCDAPPPVFHECWGMAPSGPATGEACWGLDAYSCSRHDDCGAVYYQDPSGGALAFNGCQPEPAAQGCYTSADCPDGYVCTAETMCLPPPGCDPALGCDAPVCYGECVPSQNSCATVDCGPGYHCEEQCFPGCPIGDSDGVCVDYCEATCVPDANTCTAVDCGPGYECVEICYPCDSPDGMGCPPFCQAECVPVVTCDNVLCGPDQHCELQCYPDPLPPPDPLDPPPMTGCYPVCVDNTVSGCDVITCAPGYHCEETCSVPDCMPGLGCPPVVCQAECVPDTTNVTCESLTTEDACLARPDCIAVYTGEDCECYPWGCTCAILTYERCETGWIVDPLISVGVHGRLEERQSQAF